MCFSFSFLIATVVIDCFHHYFGVGEEKVTVNYCTVMKKDATTTKSIILYVAYICDQTTFEEVLRNMFVEINKSFQDMSPVCHVDENE